MTRSIDVLNHKCSPAKWIPICCIAEDGKLKNQARVAFKGAKGYLPPPPLPPPPGSLCLPPPRNFSVTFCVIAFLPRNTLVLTSVHLHVLTACAFEFDSHYPSRIF